MEYVFRNLAFDAHVERSTPTQIKLPCRVFGLDSDPHMNDNKSNALAADESLEAA